MASLTETLLLPPDIYPELKDLSRSTLKLIESAPPTLEPVETLLRLDVNSSAIQDSLGATGLIITSFHERLPGHKNTLRKAILKTYENDVGLITFTYLKNDAGSWSRRLKGAGPTIVSSSDIASAVGTRIRDAQATRHILDSNAEEITPEDLLNFFIEDTRDKGSMRTREIFFSYRRT